MYSFNVYKEVVMHRTQIYFEESFFNKLKQTAKISNVSVSAYIRDVLEKEIKNKKTQSINFSEFSTIWQDYDIDQKTIRSKAWK